MKSWTMPRNRISSIWNNVTEPKREEEAAPTSIQIEEATDPTETADTTTSTIVATITNSSILHPTGGNYRTVCNILMP